MFEKLKKIIFDESFEIEPENLSDKVIEVNKESLENNRNLIKARPIVKEEASFDTQEAISRENVLKRIDISTPPEEKVDAVVEKKVVKQEIKKPVKPTPQYYKPKPVISPMFGMTSKEKQQSELIKRKSVPTVVPEDEGVLSPIYGVVEEDTAELKIINNQKKKVTRKPKSNVQVNLSLEEMLNLNNHDDLEFTLFDVPVDQSEFQSRENKVINEEDYK